MTRCLTTLISPVSYLLVAVLASSACRRQCCEATTTAALVYGTVRDTTGTPVPGTLVAAEALTDSCVAKLKESFGSNSVFTNALGDYRAMMFAGPTVLAPCVRVLAHAPPNSRWRDTLILGASVEFRDADQRWIACVLT